MGKYVVLLTVLFSSFSALSQINLDSLFSIWNNADVHDTNRLNAMNEIAFGCKHTQPDSAIYYFQLQHDFATSCNNTHWISKTLNNLGSTYYEQNKYDIAIGYFKEALDIAKEIDDKREMIRSLGNTGTVYFKLYQFDEALEYYNRTLALSNEITDKRFSGMTLRNIGNLHFYRKKYDEAFECFQNSLDLAEEIKDEIQIIYALNELSKIYKQRTDYQNAIELQKKIIKRCNDQKRKVPDAELSSLISTAYTELGVIQKLLGGSGKRSAILYFKKSIAIRKEINWEEGIGWNLKDIGTTFLDLEEYDSALTYLNKVIPIFKASEDRREIGFTLLMISKVHYFNNDTEEALKYIAESKEIFDSLNVENGINEANEFLAVLFIKTEKYKEALTLLKTVEKYYREIDDLLKLKNVYKDLYIVHRRLDNIPRALEYFEQYQLFKDSVNVDELNKQYIQWEFDKQHQLDSVSFVKEKENVQLRHEAKMKAKENEEARKRQVLYYGIGFLIFLLIAGFFAFRQKKKDNRIIRLQKELVEEKNQEILDSITYAKRIQSAILPTRKVVEEQLPDSFVLYKPKDIVAGDFYWIEALDDHVLFAAADCTGHGVPGAMVSVVCNNGLNRSVREYGLTDPGKILDRTRDIVIQEFEKSEEDVKDGMDIALCSLQGTTLAYAGAHNPLWIVRNGATEMEEIKADKQPIGKYDDPLPYTTHHIELQTGDTFYIFSDGYADQFGGEKGKKLKSSNFKKLLISLQQEPIQRQGPLLDEAFEKWRGSLEQLDDVCVIGVRV